MLKRILVLQWVLELCGLLAGVPREPMKALRMMLSAGFSASEEAHLELLAYQFFEEVCVGNSASCLRDVSVVIKSFIIPVMVIVSCRYDLLPAIRLSSSLKRVSLTSGTSSLPCTPSSGPCSSAIYLGRRTETH